MDNPHFYSVHFLSTSQTPLVKLYLTEAFSNEAFSGMPHEGNGKHPGQPFPSSNPDCSAESDYSPNTEFVQSIYGTYQQNQYDRYLLCSPKMRQFIFCVFLRQVSIRPTLMSHVLGKNNNKHFCLRFWQRKF